MDAVIRNGGHWRVGFENNLFLPSGEMATNNAASVSEVTDLAGAAERPIADANSARELMHFP